MSDSEKTKSIIQTAQYLAAGAQPSQLSNGFVQLFIEGGYQLIPQHIYDTAREVLGGAYDAYLKPMGIVYPFSSLRVIQMRDVLEKVLYDRLNKTEIRVAFLRGDFGGCAYWRCEEPSKMLSKKYGDIMYVELPQNIQFDTLLFFDVIVVQRGLFGENAGAVAGIIERLKAAGKKIIYEVDDDLRTLLHDNNCFYFAGPEEMKAVDYLINISDAIFTTTEELAKTLEHPEKTFVLPNSIDFGKIRTFERGEERKDILFVLWHGGNSHQRDLDNITNPLMALIDKREKLQDKIGKEIIFGLMGYFPPVLEKYTSYKFTSVVRKDEFDESLKRKATDMIVTGRNGVRYIKGVPVMQFHAYLCYLQPDISFCPLIDTQFNRGKSNIKFIESTIAGAATVVSDIGPYSSIPDDCVIKTRTPEQMCGGIQELILNEVKRKELYNNSYQWIKKNYSLEDNVDLWFDAINRVMGRK